MGNTRRQGPDGGKPVLVRDVALELPKGSHVLDDEHPAFLDVARDRSGLRSELDLAVSEVVLTLDHRARRLMGELVEERPPRVRDVLHRVAADVVLVEARHALELRVPDDDLFVIVDGAHADRKLGHELREVAASRMGR